MRPARLTRSSFCLLVLFLSASKTSAQYQFDQWKTDKGLPQNSVNSILQTKDGYLWLSTFDGLVRFDGVRFTVLNTSNSPGISSNRFLRLYEDSSGDLWAGTEDAGVVRYHEGHFTTYGKEHGLTSPYVVYQTEDANRRLIVELAYGPLMRLMDGKFVAVDSRDDPSVRPATRRASEGVPCRLDGDRIVCMGYTPGWILADGMPRSERLRAAIKDTNETIWLIMDQGGLVKIENERIAKVYKNGQGLPGRPLLFILGAHTSCLSRDAAGAFWITDLQSTRTRPLGELPAAVEVNEAYEDREGNIWFGTVRDGLFRARQRFIHAYSAADGLTQTNVYPIYQDAGGTIWVGASNLFRYDNGVFRPEKDMPNGVTALAEDQHGRLLVGTQRSLWRREDGRFKMFTQRNGGAFWAIYPDSDGTVWVGWERGLIRLQEDKETDYTTADGLAGDDVKVIIGDGANGLWIGSYGGLTHYTDGRFTSWTERDGLPSRRVRALYRDGEGVLWIGTYDGGLARFREGKFTRYSTRDGLFDNGVFQILEDGRGNFWMSSNRGIYRVRRQELEEFAAGRRATITSVAYGRSDGMLNTECNGGRWPAGIRTREGQLWFPTLDGVAVIDPAAVPINPQPPPVRVESFLVEKAAVDFGREVPVQPDQENFEIGYTALSYVNSENIKFRYRLEGLDSDWVDAGTRRTAYYSHVPPGRYTFRVIAANSDGVWNNEGAVVQLRVWPHFYQTWWFLSAVALAISGLAFMAYRSRVNRLEQARLAQEQFSHKLMASQEQERQRIAAELHDSLGQSLLIIKNRVALAQSDIDRKQTVAEQLDELSHSATAAIDECREIAYNLRPYQISRFGLSKTLHGIFMRINEVTAIKAAAEIDQIDELLAEEDQINVYRIVQECVNNIIKHSQANQASLRVKCGDGGIALTIKDDGRGFAPGANDSRGGGFGLIGIAERVRLLRGNLEIETGAGRGTRITIKIASSQMGRTGEREKGGN